MADGLYVDSRIRHGDDFWSRVISRLALMVNPASPASTGGAGSHRFAAGLPGYGVAKANQLTQPLQDFTSLTRPVRRPNSTQLGMQSGVGGAQGYPSTGQSADAFLITMSSGALGRVKRG